MSILVSFFFLLLVLFWPWLVPLGDASLWLSGGMFALVVLVWHYTSSDLVSYWEGINIVSSVTMRARYGVGIILAFCVLISLFVLSILFTLEGIWRGREASQHRWMKVVSWFGFGLIEQ